MINSIFFSFPVDNSNNVEFDSIVTVVEVFDWYDVKKEYQTKAIINDNKLSFKIEGDFKEGIYLLTSIKSKDNSIMYGNPFSTKGMIKEFTVGNPIATTYQNIKKNRSMNFKRIKKIEPHGDLFNVHIFCKNLKVSTIYECDDVQIFPYKDLVRSNELDYMDSFFENEFELSLNYDRKIFKNSIPVTVFSVYNIQASNGSVAEKFALEKVETIIDIYSSLLHSHGSVFSMMTWNETQRTYKYELTNLRYKGNLFLVADQGYNTRHYYLALNKDSSSLKVLFKLLNDAVNENDRFMKYYRYWNILEILANEKGFSNNPMKKWNGEIVQNKKGENVLIGSNALNNVFELIRLFYSNMPEDKFLNNCDGIVKVKDFLSICYQRRCCCVHCGGCRIKTKFSCSSTESESLCKKYIDLDLTQFIDYQDKLLSKLKFLVPEILLKELNDKYGKPELEKKYLEVNWK